MSFVSELAATFASKLRASTTHALTAELCKGTLPDYKLYTYLVQDLKFFQLGLNLLGNVLVHCDQPQLAIVLGKQIGFILNDENTYFANCLALLQQGSRQELQQHVASMLSPSPPTLPEVQQYLDVMHYLTFECRSYEQLITFTYVMELVYLGWAQEHSGNDLSALDYKHKEWVNLHSGPAFEQWVAFLAKEVDRVATTDAARAQIAEWYEKTLDLEIAFFDGCYNHQE